MKNTKKMLITSVAAAAITLVSIPVSAATTPKPAKAPTTTATQQKDSAVIQYAKSLIGTPYKKDGITKKGFDASGYVQHVYKQSSIDLPRSTKEIYKSGEKTTKLKQGDLVFFDTVNKKKKEANFVGIYIGQDQFIAVTESKGVSIQDLKAPYWKKQYIGATKAPVKTPAKTPTKTPVKK